ncbi:site-specific integrase [Pantoea sp. VS1]|uniref:site-specific integrase n=1 Tax=Pantoea sp. VS1 TaxID=2003658 RepID=UPI0020CCFB1B|nr:site-specific integrase [Pantoea sp. VS1]
MPDRRHHSLFSTLWNTGARIGEAAASRPSRLCWTGRARSCAFFRKRSEAGTGTRPRTRCAWCRSRILATVRHLESWLATERLKHREPLWRATDEIMRNWLKAAVRRANADGVFFSIPVTPHTFRHSWVMHLLYHRQPLKVIQALAGHKDARSIEVYTRVFALDVVATLAVSFSGEGAEAAAVLRSLPPG